MRHANFIFKNLSLVKRCSNNGNSLSRSKIHLEFSHLLTTVAVVETVAVVAPAAAATVGTIPATDAAADPTAESAIEFTMPALKALTQGQRE
jgi:hypothetical protein